MTNEAVVVVVTEIIDLLRSSGYESRAEWLRDRLGVLQDPDVSDDGRDHARNELHNIVLGMGGLVDLTLRPSKESGLSAVDARLRLDVLSDKLFALTR